MANFPSWQSRQKWILGPAPIILTLACLHVCAVADDNNNAAGVAMAAAESPAIQPAGISTGNSGGYQVILTSAAFHSGGVVPGDLYPAHSEANPVSPKEYFLGPPAVTLQPIPAGIAATIFSYRQSPDEPADKQILLAEDMATAVSSDYNRPDARPDFTNGWDEQLDPWNPNNPVVSGLDMNVNSAAGQPVNFYGEDSGAVAYDLLPGDETGSFASCNNTDQSGGCFRLTSFVGSRLSGVSLGSEMAMFSAAHLSVMNLVASHGNPTSAVGCWELYD